MEVHIIYCDVLQGHIHAAMRYYTDNEKALPVAAEVEKFCPHNLNKALLDAAEKYYQLVEKEWEKNRHGG